MTFDLLSEDNAVLQDNPNMALSYNRPNNYNNITVGQLSASGDGTLSAGVFTINNILASRSTSSSYYGNSRSDIRPTLINNAENMRADSVLYSRELRPRMIIEYKAPHIPITQKVFDQISVYNLLLHVDYLVVSNGLEHYICRMDYDDKKYLFLEEIPDYSDLLTI